MGKRAVVMCLLLLGAISVSAQTNQTRRAESEAEILWDAWGVPHIFGHDEASAFRAFGYAQMHNHANLLPRLYAQARGRAAEFYGASYLASDKAVRTMSIDRIAGQWLSQQTPQFQLDLKAFAEGINEYARQNPGKLDDAAKAILPITAQDILAHTTRLLYGFLSVVGGCSRALPEGVGLGSNAWAIGPSHSANGHAMLLANPHLPWAGEMLFFEAQVTAPGYSAYGSTLLGFPVLLIAFNDYLGWSHTVNTIDACDLYALTADGDGYSFDGQKRAFETENQVIKIKQADGTIKEEPLVVRRAVQGPVAEKDGKLVAIRIAGLQASSYAGALEEWWSMGRAHNLAEFQTALRRMQLPMFNAIYADRDGHILLLFNGLIPVRAKGDSAFWAGTVPGDTSSLVWDRMHTYDDLPKAIDPPSGWVQNSNSAPWYMTLPMLDPAKYPPYFSPSWNTPQGAPSAREERGLRMLQQDAKISYDKLIADKYSTHSELADRLAGDLIAAANQSGDENAKKAAAVLQGWDHEMNADSRGSALFEAWVVALAKHGDFFAESFDPKRPLDTPRGLKDPKAAAETLSAVAAEFQKSQVPLDVAWGDLHRFRRGTVDLPGNGASGSYGVFRVIYFAPAADGKYQSVAGDSYVAAVEFSNPVKAKVLLTYGNSSDPASPHFGDELAISAKKDLRDAWISREEIQKHLEERTQFDSAGHAIARPTKSHAASGH